MLHALWLPEITICQGLVHARILSENFESCLAASHLFCGCTTFWRSTGILAGNRLLTVMSHY